ncbi:MAG: hypothetical protein H7A24_09580 [Leptospiraceae bacterium]|nr:hypothetical protein [Leptospiraceae bacterium]MCP5512121.1 hypothetical protein [Leptospiraceae bacterium]
MVEAEKKVIEKVPGGGYQFTQYGEFLTYYHAHLQIFQMFINEKLTVPQGEKDDIYKTLKNFMVQNVKKTDHFFENVNTFAQTLKTNQPTLTEFLNLNFMTVLTKVQNKLEAQELEKLAKRDDFSSICEEIEVKIGEIFPFGSRFIMKDGLLVVEHMKTGTITKPVGLLAEMKEEQDKIAAEPPPSTPGRKKPATSLVEEDSVETPGGVSQPVAKKVQPPLQIEISILKEIVDTFGDSFTGEKLELKEEELLPMPSIPEKEAPVKQAGILDDIDDLDLNEETSQPPPKEKGLLDDVDDLDLSDDEPASSPEPQKVEVDATGILDDILTKPQVQALPIEEDEDEETPDTEEMEPEDDLLAGIDDIVVESKPAPPPPQPVLDPPKLKLVPEKKPIDHSERFNFQMYSDLNKKIFQFKSQNDIQGYNQWLKTLGTLEKSYVSIRTNLSKEMGGMKVDWNSYFQNIASKSDISVDSLKKLRSRILHLDKTKAFLDRSIKELRNQPPEVIQVLKTGWPHILTTFGFAPDYNSVESKLRNLLTRVKSDQPRKAIEKILYLAIDKLKKIPY